MKSFKHVNATSVEEAVSLCQEDAGEVNVMAGGTDLLGVLKSRLLPIYPETVVNLKTIPDLAYITEDSGGLKIGALTKLSDIIDSDIVKEKYKLLSDAALSVSSPHIRNMGTIGGNVCQHVRCWYYRTSMWVGEPFICQRKGGSICYAAIGDNRYHSIFGGPKGCFAVHPSDTATALVALDAKFKTNKRTIESKDFFDAMTGTVIESDEILTEIQIPTPTEGTAFFFKKFGFRKALDFAIVSVAAAISGSDARIVLGGVAPVPHRTTGAENVIKGNTITDALAEEAGAAAVKTAIPLAKNKYKIQIAKTLVKRAILACK